MAAETTINYNLQANGSQGRRKFHWFHWFLFKEGEWRSFRIGGFFSSDIKIMHVLPFWMISAVILNLHYTQKLHTDEIYTIVNYVQKIEN